MILVFFSSSFFCSIAIVTVFKCWRARNLYTLDFNNGYCDSFALLVSWVELGGVLCLFCSNIPELKREICGIRDDSNNNTYKKNNNHCLILHYVGQSALCVKKRSGLFGMWAICVFYLVRVLSQRQSDEDQCLCLRSFNAFNRLNCLSCVFFAFYSPLSIQFFFVCYHKNEECVFFFFHSNIRYQLAKKKYIKKTFFIFLSVDNNNEKKNRNAIVGNKVKHTHSFWGEWNRLNFS